MSVSKKLQDIPTWIIYLIIVIVTALPLVRPLGLPILISDSTTGYYTSVEELKEGDIVIYDTAVHIDKMLELHPGQVAFLHHLFSKPVKIIVTSFGLTATKILVDTTLPMIDTSDKIYGEDYVILGYMPGEEMAAATFADNINAQYKKDYFGTLIEDLSMMDNIKSLNDVDAIFISGSTQLDYILRQWTEPYELPIAMSTLSMTFPYLLPYYQSGQVIGMLDGIRGAAEYELLINKPGRAISSSDSLSTGHLLIAALIIMGNVGYALERLRRKS